MNACQQEAAVIVGTGFIGQAIARRSCAGRRLVLAELSLAAAEACADAFEAAGFDCRAAQVDIASRDSVEALAELCRSLGPAARFISAAGVSPSQSSAESHAQDGLLRHGRAAGGLRQDCRSRRRRRPRLLPVQPQAARPRARG